MFQVSRDNPAYYLTSVAHDRLPIFRTDAIKQIIAAAFDEARRSAGILIFAYVIMPDHTHILTDNARTMKDTLRFLNGISAKRVIHYLKENDHEDSLRKLRIQERDNRHKHSVYEHHPNALRITGEDAFMQKVSYIHLNPVRAGLVEHPDEYLYSSARQWHGRALENEPLTVDKGQIKWRHSR
jgi:REP element-mobilizing transposase RayT